MAFSFNYLSTGVLSLNLGEKKLTVALDIGRSSKNHKGLISLATQEEPLVWIGGGDVHYISMTRIIGFYTRQDQSSVGILIQYKGVNLCLLSDWEYFSELKDIGGFDIDVLFIYINDKSGNMNVYDAVWLTKDLPARVAVPLNCDQELYSIFEDGLKGSNIYFEAIDNDKDIELYALLSRAEMNIKN